MVRLRSHQSVSVGSGDHDQKFRQVLTKFCNTLLASTGEHSERGERWWFRESTSGASRTPAWTWTSNSHPDNSLVFATCRHLTWFIWYHFATFLQCSTVHLTCKSLRPSQDSKEGKKGDYEKQEFCKTPRKNKMFHRPDEDFAGMSAKRCKSSCRLRRIERWIISKMWLVPTLCSVWICLVDSFEGT